MYGSHVEEIKYKIEFTTIYLIFFIQDLSQLQINLQDTIQSPNLLYNNFLGSL